MSQIRAGTHCQVLAVVAQGVLTDTNNGEGLNGWSRAQWMVKDSTGGQGLNGWSRAQRMVKAEPVAKDSAGGQSIFWKLGRLKFIK